MGAAAGATWAASTRCRRSGTAGRGRSWSRCRRCPRCSWRRPDQTRRAARTAPEPQSGGGRPSMRPLHLAFIWHLHQPYYKDDLTDTYLLPWVRLRSTKDYHKMAALLDSYPRVRQTFNLVPSLLAQIDDYVRSDQPEREHDLFLRLSRKPAGELTAEERAFVLR